MKLLLNRRYRRIDCTMGLLSVDGQFFCYTLEDTYRDTGIKIFGETAIPDGVYKVSITNSPRFKRLLPLVHDVRGFSGVRIHPGNDASDTEGCVLVGERLDIARGYLYDSRKAFNRLFPLMVEAEGKGQHIELQIQHDWLNVA